LFDKLFQRLSTSGRFDIIAGKSVKHLSQRYNRAFRIKIDYIHKARLMMLRASSSSGKSLSKDCVQLSFAHHAAQKNTHSAKVKVPTLATTSRSFSWRSGLPSAARLYLGQQILVSGENIAAEVGLVCSAGLQ
jgi:hypothetical protein